MIGRASERMNLPTTHFNLPFQIRGGNLPLSEPDRGEFLLTFAQPGAAVLGLGGARLLTSGESVFSSWRFATDGPHVNAKAAEAKIPALPPVGF